METRDKIEIKEMYERSKRVYKDYERIRSFVSDKIHPDSISIDDDDRLIDTSDTLCSIMYDLEGLLYGRPAPILLGKLGKGYCADPGTNIGATINGVEFSLDELQELRHWIVRVIEWHAQHENPSDPR